MNIIKQLVEKYEGIYEANDLTRVKSPLGEYVFHNQRGEFEINGLKITINIDEVSGGMLNAEPFRIIAHLNFNLEHTLTIHPKGMWSRIMDMLKPKSTAFISKPLVKQFSLKGSTSLIQDISLVLNNKFNK